MTLKIGIGESDFKSLRESGSYYVDKTNIIYELLQQTNNKVTLFTRPRRFGKTLMMSMIENFFNVRKDSKNIFEGLDITKHNEFCENHMNKYPVVFISFKDVEALDFDNAYKMLKTTVADFCKKIADLSENENIDYDDKLAFVKLKSKTADYDEIKNFLKTITHIMNNIYGKKVILLIDEYDVPLARASENGIENTYYKKMLDVIRGILSSALKDNEYLEFAVITGCLRIAKESIFTGTNNFKSYSVIDNDFSEYFGFSQSEIDKMLKIADRTEKAEIIRDWYDGYIFGNSYVYCPWDVINYLSDLKNNKEAKPKNYWNNTSHNGILLTFIKRTDLSVDEKFEILLHNGIIEQTISDDISYNTLHGSEDNLWSILTMTGYLTKANPNEQGNTVSLKIPNKEISIIFEQTVVKYFNETKDKKNQEAVVEALFHGDEKTATNLLSDMLMDTVSFFDYREDYYHAFMTGVLAGLGYTVFSNHELGLGRPDTVLLHKKSRTAIIIETKKSKNESDMSRDCEEALNQIITRKYSQDSLLESYKTILCYGFAFFKKKVLVKLLLNDKSKSMLKSEESKH